MSCRYNSKLSAWGSLRSTTYSSSSNIGWHPPSHIGKASAPCSSRCRPSRLRPSSPQVPVAGRHRSTSRLGRLLLLLLWWWSAPGLHRHEAYPVRVVQAPSSSPSSSPFLRKPTRRYPSSLAPSSRAAEQPHSLSTAHAGSSRARVRVMPARRGLTPNVVKG
eukprot:SAG11_NODE_2564_length_3218_cov_2.712408_2_plen_162_part_00